MFSVVIPWRNREELGIALAANSSIFESHNSEIIIVNAGGDIEYLASMVRSSYKRSVQVVTLPCSEFNRSLCLNIGTLASQQELLFFLDADIVLVSDILAESIEHLRSRTRYIAIESIIESAPRQRTRSEPNWSFLRELVLTKEFITVDGRRAIIRNLVSASAHAGDGLVLLAKEHLLAVGGLNSRLSGWGFEDTDLQLRLQFQLGLERVGIGRVTHLTHDRPAEHMKGANVGSATDNYVKGNFLGSLDQDRADWLDRVHLTNIGR